MLTPTFRPLFASILVPLLLVSVSCQSATEEVPDPSPESHLAQVKERGKLTILTVPHQESAFVKTNLELGPMQKLGTAEHFLGIDIDLMSAFAETLGVELEVRPAMDENGVPGYAELIPALLREEGDLIATSFTITPERQTKIRFSEPYLEVYPAVVTRVESAVAEPTDLAGLRAATISGTSQEGHLQEAGFGKDRIHYVEFQFETFAAVLEGEADFTLQDSPTAQGVVAQYPELKIACAFSERRDHYGVGIPPGSDLEEAVNGFLQTLRSNGELERILAERHLNLAD